MLTPATRRKLHNLTQRRCLCCVKLWSAIGGVVWLASLCSRSRRDRRHRRRSHCHRRHCCSGLKDLLRLPLDRWHGLRGGSLPFAAICVTSQNRSPLFLPLGGFLWGIFSPPYLLTPLGVCPGHPPAEGTARGRDKFTQHSIAGFLSGRHVRFAKPSAHHHA